MYTYEDAEREINVLTTVINNLEYLRDLKTLQQADLQHEEPKKDEF